MNEFASLNKIQKNEFYKLLKDKRMQIIKNPSDTSSEILKLNENIISKKINKKEISDLIIKLREKCFKYFLLEEIKFNEEIFKSIAINLEIPKESISKISNIFKNTEFDKLSDKEVNEIISNSFSLYAKDISPYIYELSLSNTQSRRSRAGKTFELIIYSLYKYFEYPFESQAQIGTKAFESLNLGKNVDSILPSIKCFKEYRTKTIIGTMKTTLRERWQQVVEEVVRSNLPNIYLLTVDESFSQSGISKMSQHNIILVVLSSVKE